ncbi:hypothetical protein VOLCADRAFT_91428 [Volvox carteri f. nagariensis]|uniref:Uncharacterized protein n=1 Tax=Volvox carteri f. nagariensis TaxID=3068 RepID=D8TX21_VOLCA|nr:uncharacterized protein VOLCADRAFT_91428 [Volvox carteri f. nagariensis]EFJ47932.1 hypothetical protein VOLCADRAFT_91428 [Volvox carteri f. nagariensis]|eukprot:XP_002951038.1 hypothetical protein VOLCADRAFT_91428 [Volvox carteri f. nagariensis]
MFHTWTQISPPGAARGPSFHDREQFGGNTSRLLPTSRGPRSGSPSDRHAAHRRAPFGEDFIPYKFCLSDPSGRLVTGLAPHSQPQQRCCAAASFRQRAARHPSCPLTALSKVQQIFEAPPITIDRLMKQVSCTKTKLHDGWATVGNRTSLHLHHFHPTILFAFLFAATAVSLSTAPVDQPFRYNPRAKQHYIHQSHRTQPTTQHTNLILHRFNTASGTNGRHNLSQPATKEYKA